MSDIHFAGSILQSTQVQRQQEIQRSRDIRRQQELEKDVAMQDDQLEHQVESTAEPGAVRAHRVDDAPPPQAHVDIKA
jgi:hypothetical protein